MTQRPWAVGLKLSEANTKALRFINSVFCSQMFMHVFVLFGYLISRGTNFRGFCGAWYP